jgi:ABC-type multidrug transport system ATPase subunit
MIDFTELTAEGVSRHFGRRRAISRISFQTHSGSILGLLGPNGAGKSTMLAMRCCVRAKGTSATARPRRSRRVRRCGDRSASSATTCSSTRN